MATARQFEQATNSGMISLNFQSDHGTPGRLAWIRRIGILPINGQNPTRQFDVKGLSNKQLMG
ncbi:MAG: hypothetical protein ACYDDD_00525 [Acidithiobacillus ferrivorans]